MVEKEQEYTELQQTEESEIIHGEEHQRKVMTLCVTMALEMENVFKMYSYRLATIGAFKERIEQLIQVYKEEMYNLNSNSDE